MALLGSKYQFYATGLTHDERGYPSDKEDVQIELVTRLNDKIIKNSDKIIVDGSTWMVEGRRKDQCHVVIRRSPESNTNFFQFVFMALDTADLRFYFDEVY